MKTKYFIGSLIIIGLLLLLLSSQVNATLPVYFISTNDADSKYTNDANCIDTSLSTFAYTTTTTNDNYIEAVFGSGFESAILSNTIYINLGWYRGSTGYSSQFVDIDVSYVESTTATSWSWVNLVTDGTYSYNTGYTLNIGKIVYCNGVRVRSYDSSRLYTFRVFSLEPQYYSVSTTKIFSTDFFDWTETKWANVTSGDSWANCSMVANYDFSKPEKTLNGNNKITVGKCYNTSLIHFQNFLFSTGTLEHQYSSVTGWKVWANVTGNASTLNHYENIAHATGTHEHNYITATHTYNIWANYTGDTPTITQYSNIVNATGTHEYQWNPTLWKFYDWANYTGYKTDLSIEENLEQVNGKYETRYDDEKGWNVWNNYTGDPSPDDPSPLGAYNKWRLVSLPINESIIKESVRLQGDGNNYDWDDAVSNGIILDFLFGWDIENQNYNLADTFDGYCGYWLYFYENYTMVIDDKPTINLYDDIINATGTHEYNFNGLTYNIWANYTGDTTPLHQLQNIINASGGHEYLLNGTGYWDWANYTGDTTPISIFEDVYNTTGSIEYNINETGYNVWANYTGITTPMTLYENIVDAIGEHEYILNGTGYYVWANYTGTGGSPPALILYKNYTNATGTLESNTDDGDTWYIWANATGNESTGCGNTSLSKYYNLKKCKGTLDSQYNLTTGYKVWANYTGTKDAVNSAVRVDTPIIMLLLGMVMLPIGFVLFRVSSKIKKDKKKTEDGFGK